MNKRVPQSLLIENQPAKKSNECIGNNASMHAQLLQSCLTLCDPMDYNLPGSSHLRILQARILEQVAMPSCRVSSLPRDQTMFPVLEVDSLPIGPPGRLLGNKSQQ